MLTGIGLRNFKAFGDEMQEAPLSKITLIYGPNSGGKSSIIQAFLLLKQSLKKDYTSDKRTLVPKGDFVDLGSPQSILHKHDMDRELGIAVMYRNLELGDESAENEVGFAFSDDCVLSKVSYRIISHKDREKLLDAVAKNCDGLWDIDVRVKDLDIPVSGPLPIYGNFLPTLTFWALSNEELTPIQEVERYMNWKMNRVLALAQVGALAHAQDEARKRTSNIGELNLAEDEVLYLTPEIIPEEYESRLRSLNYLGPLRSAPQRIYTRSSTDDSNTGTQGEFSANVLSGDPDDVETKVNRWFRQFEIPYDIHARKWDEVSRVGEFIIIELMPLDKKGDIFDEDFTLTLADVGYGINQLLPVIIEGVASEEGAILCVEQPEIHLHPRLQANIADLMIDTIADEDGKRKQWIVETHSELLILRLQRRIREGKIKPKDISVLYVDPNDESTEGSAIIPLRMDENGDFIDHWPEGFFDEAFNELTTEPDDPSRLAVNPAKNGGTTASIQSEEPIVE